jgi:copper chaperone CopZ
VRAACRSVTGVQSVDVRYEEKRVTVTFDPARATPEAFLKAIENAGYEPSLVDAPPS